MFMEEILRLFPKALNEKLRFKITGRWNDLQEIRCRPNQQIELIFDEKVVWVEDMIPNQKDRQFILNQLSQFSLYRMENELREGYITIEGGHRVGLAGKVNTLGGLVKAEIGRASCRGGE